MPTDRIPEAVLSRIWNEGWHSRELRTTDGRRVAVVYRGVWTHSNGPDFRDAMIEIDGRLAQGAVELHVRESDWVSHGHQFDTAYDAVILHVVLENDLLHPSSGPAGAAIPTVKIAPFLHGSIEQFMSTIVPLDLGNLGQRACLPTLAGERPEEIRAVLRREGWRRLVEKQLRFQQEMMARSAGETLYRGMLDSLGLSGNRSGMEAVADRLPLIMIERIAVELGVKGLSAAFLGTGGFLPLSPGHQALVSEQTVDTSQIESCWQALVQEYGLSLTSAPAWNLNRVRPLNHPARRLASMAGLLNVAAADGLLAYLMRLPLDDGASWDRWLASAQPAIGESRRRQIVVNTLAPFVAAYADATGDQSLMEQIGVVWEQLPGGVDDDVARKTIKQIVGERRFQVRSALEVQGLHQIGRQGCAHLRCFECPIAALAVQFEEQRFSG
ncbi:DUF2851 family protein [soil metagenome]